MNHIQAINRVERAVAGLSALFLAHKSGSPITAAETVALARLEDAIRNLDAVTDATDPEVATSSQPVEDEYSYRSSCVVRPPSSQTSGKD